MQRTYREYGCAQSRHTTQTTPEHLITLQGTVQQLIFYIVDMWIGLKV